MNVRTNAEWLNALTGSGEPLNLALSDLRRYLVRAAAYALRRLGRGRSADMDPLAEDSAQDAPVRSPPAPARIPRRQPVHDVGVQVRRACSAGRARRERWSRLSLDSVLQGSDLTQRLLPESAEELDPQQRALQGEVLATLREAVATQLTTRQRQALTAIVFDEVPLDELARHWGSNRNALYKLLHDARRKLKAHLASRDLDVQEMLDLFGRTERPRR